MKDLMKCLSIAFSAVFVLTVNAGNQVSLSSEQTVMFKEIINSRGAACPEVIAVYAQELGASDAAKYKVYCGIEGKMRSGLVYMIKVAMDPAKTITVKRSGLNE